MIILFEIELLLILAEAGWFQNRWLFLLFASGEIFLAAWLVISLIATFRMKVKVRPYEGEVRLSHRAKVRADITHTALIRKKIKVSAHLTLPTGEKKKFRYTAYLSGNDMSLPVPALVIGDSRFTVDRMVYSDAAGIFLFSKKVNKSVTIPVVPDPSLRTEIDKDEAEKDFLQRNVVIEKGKDISHDEIRSFREYRHGDEKRDIHWNISARFGKYYVKEYEGRSEEKEAGSERKNGRETDDGDRISRRTRTDYNLKKVHYVTGFRSYVDSDLFTMLLRGGLAALVVLTLLLQMTLFGHPFKFEVIWPVLAIIVTAAAMTAAEATHRFRIITPVTFLLTAVLILITHLRAVANEVYTFGRWLAGSYKYTDSTPYTDLTLALVVAVIILTGLFFLILKYRGTSIVLFAMASTIYIARDSLDIADTESMSGVMLCVMAVAGMAYIVLADIGLHGRRRFALFLKETDAGNITAIAAGIASFVIGIAVAGILPHLSENQFSGSDVLSGRYADSTMNNIFEAENDGIERFAQLYKVSYRVPFDGRVGQQLNQFTGETQLIVRNESHSLVRDDLYLRFFTGRTYKDGAWSGGDPEALRDKSIEEAAKKIGLSDEETERRIMNQNRYFNSGIFTYLQYQHSMMHLMDGGGMSFYTYRIENAKSENTALAYDLSKVSVPIGYMGGATEGGTEGPSFAVIPSLDSCSFDISDTLTSLEQYASLYMPQSEESENVRNNLFNAEVQEAYRKNYSKYYLEVPDEGLEQTRQLVEDQPLDDIEEITAYIRYILASHATYSLKARDPVGSMDPVEYFLFSSHTGYCEQFASAAVILYRLYGIPARYVSGYRVAPSDFGTDGTAEVPDSSAHAWVEIYLPSTGWLPIEMTPATLPKDAGTDVTGYPTDKAKMIWPEFTEGNLLEIQEEHGWTGRIFRTKESSAKSSTQSRATEERNKSTQQQASADATDTTGTSQTAEKQSSVAAFFEKYRTAVIFIIIAIAAVLAFIFIRKIREYRFRHAGLRAIARRTDIVIAHEGDFMIPLTAEQSERFTRYFRLLDKAVYTDYRGTTEEVEWAYETYDEFLTLFSNKLILSRH